jgi:UDP-N-acetylglucosamine 4,6-dehydratase (inverting)
MLDGKSILVTGATGSFGRAFVEHAIKKYKKIKRLVVFSRDELKQHEMSMLYSANKFPFLRYFIGDIRDKSRLTSALEDIDYVVHAAALKQVTSTEYNPIEAIKTNVIGAQNIIEACIDKNVKKIIAISTDKAVSPINLYGATKLCSDKLFLSANNIIGKKDISFSIVRYGNVLGSRGSVLSNFIQQKKTGVINITDKNMTRFHILLSESIDMVLWSLKNCMGGEILIPKLPSYKILDFANAICSKCKIKYTGIRPGEKIHEDLITSGESKDTLDIGKYYVVINNHNKKIYNFYINKWKVKKVSDNFVYNSKTNKVFLSSIQLKRIIDKEIKKIYNKNNN